jgi:hypothetical protein
MYKYMKCNIGCSAEITDLCCTTGGWERGSRDCKVMEHGGDTGITGAESHKKVKKFKEKSIGDVKMKSLAILSPRKKLSLQRKTKKEA